jgi:hypothetical protein
MSEEIADSQDDDSTNPIDLSSFNYSLPPGITGAMGSTASYGTVTINTTAGFNGTSGAYLYNSGSSYNWNNMTMTGNGKPQTGLHVTTDAEFEGDIKWKGRSLGKLLEQIEDRLAILQPDPAKLEKHEALKKAYNHYKLLEKLIGED